ncbi:hypothetical protein [Pseudanabaena sp. 'Roaring Creek']|uniref:hypothetical protein n=1 Tax=Pseudanabaena sp. 'Roaring Creek' TaxID=1681830 RepID=UPI0006D795C1|nr:hypothetical protein [Pseudanabaena sp. 'Roaring Creek']
MKNGAQLCGCDDCKKNKRSKSDCGCGGKGKKLAQPKKLLKLDSTKSPEYTIAFLEARKIYS